MSFFNEIYDTNNFESDKKLSRLSRLEDIRLPFEKDQFWFERPSNPTGLVRKIEHAAFIKEVSGFDQERDARTEQNYQNNIWSLEDACQCPCVKCKCGLHKHCEADEKCEAFKAHQQRLADEQRLNSQGKADTWRQEKGVKITHHSGGETWEIPIKTKSRPIARKAIQAVLPYLDLFRKTLARHYRTDADSHEVQEAFTDCLAAIGAGLEATINEECRKV